MDYLEPFTENFLIFKQNVSFFCITCVLVSIIAIILTWKINIVDEPVETDEKTNLSNDNETKIENVEDKTDKPKVKDARTRTREALEKTFTENELQTEIEVEKLQLANILELIKKDEEKFQIGTLQELEEQMKLYKE